MQQVLIHQKCAKKTDLLILKYGVDKSNIDIFKKVTMVQTV